MAIGRKTGGRKVGSPNRVTAAQRAQIASSGLTPLDYMLQVLRDENQPAENRMWAAVKAAPYVHPRKSAVTVTSDTELTHEECLDLLRKPDSRRPTHNIDATPTENRNN
jgi:hypothetical protein